MYGLILVSACISLGEGPQVTIPPSILCVDEIAKLLSMEGKKVTCDKRVAGKIALVSLEKQGWQAATSALASGLGLKLTKTGDQHYVLQLDPKQQKIDETLRQAVGTLLEQDLRRSVDVASLAPGGLDPAALSPLSIAGQENTSHAVEIQLHIASTKSDLTGLLWFLETNHCESLTHNSWTWFETEGAISQNELFPSSSRGYLVKTIGPAVAGLTAAPLERSLITAEAGNMLVRSNSLSWDPMTEQLSGIVQRSLCASYPFGWRKYNFIPDVFSFPNLDAKKIYEEAKQGPHYSLGQQQTEEFSAKLDGKESFQLPIQCGSIIEATREWAIQGRHDVIMEFSPDFDQRWRRSSVSSLRETLMLDSRIAFSNSPQSGEIKAYLRDVLGANDSDASVKLIAQRRPWWVKKVGGIPTIRCVYDFYTSSDTLLGPALLDLYRHSLSPAEPGQSAAKIADVMRFALNTDTDANCLLLRAHVSLSCPIISSLHPFLCALGGTSAEYQKKVWSQLSKTGSASLQLAQLGPPQLENLLLDLRNVAAAGVDSSVSRVATSLARNDAYQALSRGRIDFHFIGSSDEDPHIGDLRADLVIPAVEDLSPAMKNAMNLASLAGVPLLSGDINIALGVGGKVILPGSSTDGHH